MRTFRWLAALMLAITTTVSAQTPKQTLDSSAVAALMPVLREMVPDTVVAVRADPSNVTAVALGTALAEMLQVPDPDARVSPTH